MTLEGELQSSYAEARWRLMNGRTRPVVIPKPKTIREAILTLRVVTEEPERWPPYMPEVPYDTGIFPPVFEEWEDGVQSILDRLGLGFNIVRSKSRAKHLSNARREVSRYLRKKHGWSYTRIGKLLGGRDHATILALLDPSKLREAYWKRKAKLAGVAPLSVDGNGIVLQEV